MTDLTRATSLYSPPPARQAQGSQSEISFYRPPLDDAPINNHALRSLSPDDLQKLKYKIDLDKQVVEKQRRLAREWEKKIERDKKYVQHQSFGRNNRTTRLNPEELEEILIKGRAPSPDLDMPQQYPILHQQQQQQQQPYNSNDNTPPNAYGSPRQPPVNNYSQYPTYSTAQPPPPLNNFSNKNSVDFHHFYGLNNNLNSNGTIPQSSSNPAQLVKGDAHDPFLLFDPNKEGQNVFNAIPQQDLYDPWGRPGAGAPLIHGPTGQKFTRYSGSLQDKLNTNGPLGFHQKQYTDDINEQKRDLEIEQRRRQQQEVEIRANVGNTAEWITQLEGNRYPLRLHLPTTETTREITGARTRFRSNDSRILHDDLVQQAQERSRLHKINRYQDNIAELHHSEAMNNWWGRSGGGAPSMTNRRHNVSNTFEQSRQKWSTNHLGQLIMTEDEAPNPVKVLATDYYYPKTKQLSNHRNYYQAATDDQAL